MLASRTCAARRSALSSPSRPSPTTRDVYDRAAAALREAELSAVAVEAEVAAAGARCARGAEQARADLAKRRNAARELDQRPTAARRARSRVRRSSARTSTQELRPELSDLASRYIRELTDGRYCELELDDQYNIIVLEDAIPKPVISGGEEDLANLVLRLAISRDDRRARRPARSRC